jgi:hypothetical protein
MRIFPPPDFRSLWQKVQLKDSVSVQRELEQGMFYEFAKYRTGRAISS